MKKYTPEILAGIAAADRRRVELDNAWGYTTSIENFTACKSTSFATPDLHSVELGSVLPGRSAPHANDVDLQAVKFWPLMGISAAKHGNGGAWQAWTLAKSLDKPGTGAIPLAELQDLARDLGIHSKTWRRWLAAARHLKVLWDRHECLVLASHANAAILFDCESIGPRPASIRAGDLVGKGWRSFVWAAYEQTFNGRQISRAKQEQLSGVPVRTQQAYDNQAGVDRRPHYAISDRPGDELDGATEFEHRPGAFKFYEKRGRRCKLAWRLPDSRTTSAAESLQRGRSKKIQKEITRIIYQRENGSFILERASSFDTGNGQIFRIFHQTGPQLRATERKIAQMDLQPARELYLHRSYGKRADLWHVRPLGGVAA